MLTIFEGALEIQSFCDLQGWNSCFIGGIAVQRWGQPRVTRDIDINLLTGFGGERHFIDTLLSRYHPRLPDAAEFALRSRVLLLQTDGGVGIDVSLGALPYESEIVQRATAFEFSAGVSLRTCSAEDLMVLKLFAARAIDIRDAEGVAVRHARSLDWRYIEAKLIPLAEAKGDPLILGSFQRIRAIAVGASTPGA